MAPVQWPMRAGERSRRRASSPTADFYTNDRKARFIAPEIPALRTETSAGAAAAAQHRPHPRPVAHHDPQRPEPAAGRSICRSRLSRFIPTMPADTASSTTALRASPPTTASASCKVVVSERPAARHAVRADPLERGERLGRARRRAGRAASPIRSPASPRARRRRRRSRLTNMCSAASCCRASSCDLPASLWWARAAVDRRLRLSVRRQCRSGALAVMAARGRGRAIIAEYRDFGGGVYRAASFAGDRIETCLFVGPAHDAGDWDVVKSLFAAGCAQRRSAPHAAVGPLDRGRRQRRARRLRLLRRRPRHDLRCHRGGARTAAEIGAQAQGRHQLRLLHSRIEAADRAGGRTRAGLAATQVELQPRAS